MAKLLGDAFRCGGTIVYSVCTISDAEGTGIIDRFVEESPGWTLESTRLLRPDRDGTDGFYIARMLRD